jgi:CMP-N-acetylneuraminic acid synthetase
MKIIAHIPARQGSERLPLKNLQKMDGKSIIDHTIETCLKSKLISELYVNSESDLIIDSVKHYPIKIFKRSKELSEDFITQDKFNYDFIKNFSCDYFMLINPVCPLIDQHDIENVINFCLQNKYDSVFTVTRHMAHVLLGNQPINFNPSNHLERTQDLSPVYSINWAINIWKRDSFISFYEKNGYGVFVDNIGYYELPFSHAIKINYREDLILAEQMYRLRNL